jgi:hypothetical protein
MFAVTEIAGVRLGEKDIDQRGATDRVRKREGRRLVDPHQRRMNDKPAVGTERQSQLHSLDGIVAAIRIAGEISFAHTGNEVADIAPIGDRPGKSEEHQISSRDEGRRQAGLSDPDLCLARERRFRNLSKGIDADNVVFTETRAPIL